MVTRGVFKKEILTFLHVGHTDEDIDKVFSRIKIRLDFSDAVALDDMNPNLRASYTP